MKDKPAGDRTRFARGFATISLILGLGHFALAAPPLPSSGVCGFTLTLNYPFAYLYGSSPGPFVVNWVGNVDFGAHTITANVVVQNPSTAVLTTESQGTFSEPFTVAAGPISGAYTITFSVNNAAYTFNLMPVNGGNRVLMQLFSPAAGIQEEGAVGVCRI
jgi:hypothetical protein